MKLEDRILKYLPLLAPVPTAWVVGVATFTLMHFPLPVAVIASLITEGLGFVAINTAIQMREYNRRLKADEIAKKMQAPVGQAYAATALYMVVATIMTVLLHVFPSMVAYAPITFVLMTVAGAWLFALRSDFDEKVLERDAGRAQAKQARADRKKNSAKSATQSEQSAKKSVAGASHSAKSATQSVGLSRTYPRRCDYCASDSPFGEIKSPNAVGGHMKKHHPELCKPKASAVFEAMLQEKAGK